MKLRCLVGYSAPFLALCRGLKSLLLNGSAGVVKVLIYHNISGDKLALFRRQIQYLASTYQFLTPIQFQEFLQVKYRISGINLLLTFDDGFKSNRIVAEEVLEPLGIKGIFFVCTEFIGLQDVQKRNEFIVQQIYDGNVDNSKIIFDMEPLTWEDLKYLLARGHVIGSHGCNHRHLSSIHPQQDLHDEIVESGSILEEKLGVPINLFAYPFGDINSINKNAMDLIKERYTYCFSGIRGKNFYPFSNYAIKRDTISLDDPLSYVRFIIEGGLDIIYRKKVRKLLELSDESADYAG